LKAPPVLTRSVSVAVRPSTKKPPDGASLPTAGALAIRSPVADRQVPTNAGRFSASPSDPAMAARNVPPQIASDRTRGRSPRNHKPINRREAAPSGPEMGKCRCEWHSPTRVSESTPIAALTR
jgi:hypothetical protein